MQFPVVRIIILITNSTITIDLYQNKISLNQFWNQREEGLEQRELIKKLGLQVERMIDSEE